MISASVKIISQTLRNVYRNARKILHPRYQRVWQKVLCAIQLAGGGPLPRADSLSLWRLRSRRPRHLVRAKRLPDWPGWSPWIFPAPACCLATRRGQPPKTSTTPAGRSFIPVNHGRRTLPGFPCISPLRNGIRGYETRGAALTLSLAVRGTTSTRVLFEWHSSERRPGARTRAAHRTCRSRR